MLDFPAFTEPVGCTWPADDRDPVAWRRGRARYAVWVVDAELGAVQARWRQAQAHLAGLLWPSQRQPHITVCVGGFLCDVARCDDDLVPAHLAARQAAMQAAALPAFELQIGRLNSFDSAAFLQVHDPTGGLARLRQVLLGGQSEFRDTPYVPHLTVGLYRQAVPKAALVEQLRVFEAGPGVPLPVGAVRLVSYEAHSLGGRLREEWAQPLV